MKRKFTAHSNGNIVKIIHGVYSMIFYGARTQYNPIGTNFIAVIRILKDILRRFYNRIEPKGHNLMVQLPHNDIRLHGSRQNVKPAA